MEIRGSGSKVYLKSLGIEDADSIVDKANDYEIAYNIAEWGKFPHPYQKPDALNFIEFATKAHMDGLELHLGIRLTETNELIGVIGLKNINVKNKKAEIGYWIGKNFRKKGYGTEAAGLILEYAFGKLKLNKIAAMMFAFNEPSVKIVQKFGFVREGLLRDDVFHKDGFEDSLVFGLLKKDYKSNVGISVKE